jgi:hypothetical protein
LGGGWKWPRLAMGLEMADECGLKAFGGEAGVVFDGFAAEEHAIAGAFDDSEMGENVYAFGGNDETESSSTVIPLDSSNRHPDTSGETGRRL